MRFSEVLLGGIGVALDEDPVLHVKMGHRAIRRRKMASWSCPVCGDEADENEIDPHGHFDSDDDDDGDDD